MTGLPSFDAPAPPAVRRPVFTLRFGGGSGGSGLMGAVASAAGSGGGTDPWADHLLSVSLDLGLAPRADTAVVVMASGGEAPEAALEDEGTIAIGYADSEAIPVFTGRIASIRRGLAGAATLTAINGGGILSRRRVNSAYEKQSAGAIVRDLAGAADVATGTVEDGLDFPFYVIDDRQTVLGHMADLARKCGHETWFSPEGTLHFAPLPGGEPVRTFRYGADILALQCREGPAPAGLTLVGEGAAGSQGEDAWPWIVQDPAGLTAEAGDPDGGRIDGDGSLRSADASRKAAESRLAATGRTALLGRIQVPGAPEVLVGSAIAIADAPEEVLNGEGIVLRVRHRFSKTGGFTTLIDFSQPGNGGGGFL